MPLESKSFILAFGDHLDAIIFGEFHTILSGAEDDDIVSGFDMVEEVEVGLDIEEGGDPGVSAVEGVDVVTAVFIRAAQVVLRDGEFAAPVVGDRFGDVIVDLGHDEVANMLFFSFADDGKIGRVLAPLLHSLVRNGVVVRGIGHLFDIDDVIDMVIYVAALIDRMQGEVLVEFEIGIVADEILVASCEDLAERLEQYLKALAYFFAAGPPGETSRRCKKL